MTIAKTMRGAIKAMAPLRKKHQTKNVKRLMTSDKAYKIEKPSKGVKKYAPEWKTKATLLPKSKGKKK